jgi:hypothetical protein
LEKKGNPAAILVPLAICDCAEDREEFVPHNPFAGLFPRYFTKIPMLYRTTGAVPADFVLTVRSFPADIIP